MEHKESYLSSLSTLGSFYIPFLLICIIHEYGYFTIVGFQLISNLSIYDFISGSLLLAPLLIWPYISMSFDVYSGYLNFSVEKQDKVSEWISLHKDIRRYAIFGTIAILIIFFLYRPIILLGAVVFLAAVFWVLFTRRRLIALPESVSFPIYIIFYAGPFFIGIVYVLGLLHGNLDISRNSYRVKVAGLESDLLWIRSISSGAVAMDSSMSYVYFVPNDKIELVYHVSDLCDGFGFWRNRSTFAVVRDYITGNVPCSSPDRCRAN